MIGLDCLDNTFDNEENASQILNQLLPEIKTGNTYPEISKILNWDLFKDKYKSGNDEQKTNKIKNLCFAIKNLADVEISGLKNKIIKEKLSELKKLKQSKISKIKKNNNTNNTKEITVLKDFYIKELHGKREKEQNIILQCVKPGIAGDQSKRGNRAEYLELINSQVHDKGKMNVSEKLICVISAPNFFITRIEDYVNNSLLKEAEKSFPSKKEYYKNNYPTVECMKKFAKVLKNIDEHIKKYVELYNDSLKSNSSNLIQYFTEMFNILFEKIRNNMINEEHSEPPELSKQEEVPPNIGTSNLYDRSVPKKLKDCLLQDFECFTKNNSYYLQHIEYHKDTDIKKRLDPLSFQGSFMPNGTNQFRWRITDSQLLNYDVKSISLIKVKKAFADKIIDLND